MGIIYLFIEFEQNVWAYIKCPQISSSFSSNFWIRHWFGTWYGVACLKVYCTPWKIVFTPQLLPAPGTSAWSVLAVVSWDLSRSSVRAALVSAQKHSQYTGCGQKCPTTTIAISQKWPYFFIAKFCMIIPDGCLHWCIIFIHKILLMANGKNRNKKNAFCKSPASNTQVTSNKIFTAL